MGRRVFRSGHPTAPKAARERGSAELTLVATDPKQLTLASGQTRELVRYLFPAANTLAMPVRLATPSCAKRS